MTKNGLEISQQTKELQQDTEKLKKLIKQVENSGVAAWETGDLLKIVKGKNGYAIKYQTFELYTKTELAISPQTANKYIKIREQFTIEEIGNLMLVSHLSVIAEIENDKVRKLVLKNFKEKEEKELNSKKTKSYKTTVNDVIAVVTIIMDSELAKVNSKLIGGVIDVINQKSKDEQKQKRAAKGTNQKDLFGDTFTSEFFKDITALIENEPIDEMGVVALFCVMFQSLRGTQFIWENDNVTFVSIEYVRVAFPDACIRCKRIGKKEKILICM